MSIKLVSASLFSLTDYLHFSQVDVGQPSLSHFFSTF